MGALLSDNPDLLRATTSASRHAYARKLWDRGEVEEALAALPSTNDILHKRLSEERGILEKRTPLEITTPLPRPQETQRQEQLDVLHFLTNSLPFTQSGYTVRSHRLLQAQTQAGIKLEAVTRLGYPVTTGSLRAPACSELDGIRYHRLLPTSLARMPHARLEQQAHHLSQLVSQLNPRVLHTTTDYHNGLTVHSVAKHHDLPWVYEMRGQLEKTWVARQDPQYRESAEKSERFRAWHECETHTASQASAVVVLSDIQKEELIERGIDESKIYILPNAFDWPDNVERIGRQEARGRLGLPEADVWIGSISAIIDYEGFDTLIKAVKNVRDMGVDARAAIVGDGISLAHLKRLRSELNLEEYVVLPGRVPIDKSHTWYQALDLFAVPRRDTPVCRIVTPIKPLEALACGTPILASDLPALSLAPSYGAGRGIEADNPEKWAKAILKTMPDSSAYTKMAEAALQLSYANTWDSNAQTSLKMYGDIS